MTDGAMCVNGAVYSRFFTVAINSSLLVKVLNGRNEFPVQTAPMESPPDGQKVQKNPC